MTKKMNKTLVITTLLCLLPIIPGLIVYPDLPDQIAIHWNTAGEADNFAHKAIAVWGLPLLMATIHLFTILMTNNDPKKENTAKAFKQLIIWLIPIMTLIIVPLTLFKALGYDIRIETIAPILVGLIIIICGNYMPKTKQNFTVGIKLPWTLTSEENWNKTHRLAGYLWIIGGLGIILTGFINFSPVVIMIILIVMIIIIPTVYSFVLYKKGE